MLKGGKAVRDKNGKIIKAAEYQSSVPENEVARIAPNRGFFMDTRVITQKQLERFREEVDSKVNDPFQVLLRQRKLPMSLLADSTKNVKCHLLETEPFDKTFGSKSLRKKPKISVASMEEMANRADTAEGT